MDEKDTKPTMATILGGQEFEAKKRDGTTEVVTIRQLTIKQISKQWLLVALEEDKQVELYCGKPDGWDDGLTIESHEEIVNIGSALNRPTIARWGERRRADLADLQNMTKGLNLPSQTLSSPSGASSEKHPAK